MYIYTIGFMCLTSPPRYGQIIDIKSMTSSFAQGIKCTELFFLTLFFSLCCQSIFKKVHSILQLPFDWRLRTWIIITAQPVYSPLALEWVNRRCGSWMRWSGSGTWSLTHWVAGSSWIRNMTHALWVGS